MNEPHPTTVDLGTLYASLGWTRDKAKQDWKVRIASGQTNKEIHDALIRLGQQGGTHDEQDSFCGLDYDCRARRVR